MTDIPRISPAEAAEKMREGYTYVDVRTPEEFEAGHPKDAVNVPIALSQGGTMTPNPDFLEIMKASFALDAKIITGCLAGGRSMRAAQALASAGFTNVMDQRAGWGGAKDPFGQIVEPGWSKAGLPVETGAGKTRSR